MKKVVVTLCLLAVLGGGGLSAASRSARSADEETESRSRSRSRSKKELTRSDKKMMKKEEKQRAKEEKKRKAALEKARKQQKKEVKPKKARSAKERLAEKAKAQKLEREEKKARENQAKEERKATEKEQAKRVQEEKKQKAALEKARKQEEKDLKAKAQKQKHEQLKARENQAKEERKRRDMLKQENNKQERAQRLIDFENKKKHKKDEHHNKAEKLAEIDRQLTIKDQKRGKEQAERLTFARQHRVEKMNTWKELHALETSRDIDGGRYADLYKAPAWPVACGFFESKDLLNVSVNYKYATDGYADDRSSTDITGIAFGYQPITLQDISLASKLVNNGTLTYVGNAKLQAANKGSGPTYAAAIATSGDIAATAAALADYASSDAATAAANTYFKSLAETPINFNGKTEEYGASIDFARYVMGKNVQLGVQVPVLYRQNKLECDFEYIKDFLAAKGISELGGNASGLGDIVLFANVQTGARTFEKLLGGLKVSLATGDKASTSKLWAPELGIGHTQFSVYTGMLMDYSRLLNPHVYLEGIYSMVGHEDKRLPVLVNITETNSTILTAEKMAMGDRLKIANAGINLSVFDTTIKGFGDKVTRVRMIRGLEFKARFGNVIEKFIARRGFLDIYYDMNVKFKDSARGLNTQDYNLDILSDRTNMMAHKIGTEFTYQFDADARLRAGVIYTFAGINASKTFEINSAFGYSF